MNKNSESAAHTTASSSSREPAFVMDGDGIVVQWSSVAEDLFGWTREEAVGRKLSELIIPERNRAVHEAGLKRFMSSKGSGALLNRKLDLTMLHRDGREFPLAITISSKETADARTFPTYVERE